MSELEVAAVLHGLYQGAWAAPALAGMPVGAVWNHTPPYRFIWDGIKST